MAEIINTTLDNILSYRAEKNKELLVTSVAEEPLQVDVLVEVNSNVMMKCRTSAKKIKPYLQYSNRAVNIEQLMLESHDFGDSTTWPDSTTSTFDLIPNPGYKLIITSIQARFPEDVDLSNNSLSFIINKYVPPYGVVPAAVQTYDSMQSLLLQSNDRWSEIEYTNTNAFSKPMIDVKFRYAGSDDAEWSKLTLYSSRGESIRCTLSSHTPLLDKQGQPLQDPCYAVFNCKRVLDF